VPGFLSAIGDAWRTSASTPPGQGFGRYLGTIATIFFIFWIIHLRAMIVAQDQRMQILAINCASSWPSTPCPS
jgi:hypothetical protein